ncbi:MAG: peptide ABC transporter substrate-binding protein [Erysipelotrichaceae bacterium]|nr:peptide ABC transporter substrate-binding protein [Erysipelotrichaceae bacterium]
MKKLLGVLLALFMLVGCGGGKTENNAPQSGGDAAPTASQVTVQVPADIMSMDPQYATDGQSFSAQNLCFAGLYQLDKDGKPVPDMAESVDVSEDGTVYTFHLRESYWSNGDKVTADDFVFGWQRLTSEALASDYNWYLETANVVNGDCYDTSTGLTPEDLGVEAVDESTFRVTLTQPTGFFMQIVTFPSTFPCNRAFYETVGDQYGLSLNNLVFNGPYNMTSWDGGYGYSFELSDKYYDYENYKANYVEKVNFRVVSDTQSALMDYEQGNLDIVNLSGSQVMANKGVEGFTSNLGSYTYYLLINNNYLAADANQATANINVRKAMSYGIDREDIAKTINDGSVASEGIVPFKLAGNPVTGVDFREEAGAVCGYDLELAKQYAETAKQELGVDKISINLLYSSDQGDPEIQACTRIAAQLEEIGFEVTLNPQPKKTRLNVYQHVDLAAGDHGVADFEVSLTRWGPDYGDPQTYMDLFISKNTSNNQGGYWSDTYDTLIKDAEAAGTSAADRWAKFIEAEKVLVEEDCGVIPVYQNGTAMLVNPRLVSGIEFHSASVDVYRHIAVK